jgi:hypothetical protein
VRLASQHHAAVGEYTHEATAACRAMWPAVPAARVHNACPLAHMSSHKTLMCARSPSSAMDQLTWCCWCPCRLILFLQQSSVEWASSLWLKVVQELDPQFQRTVRPGRHISVNPMLARGHRKALMLSHECASIAKGPLREGYKVDHRKKYADTCSSLYGLQLIAGAVCR